MKHYINLQILFCITLILGRSSTSSIHLENSMMRAQIIHIDRPGYQYPDSSFAAMIGTNWKDNKPHNIERAPWGPNTNFDIHLSGNDSVTIYYTDMKGILVDKAFRIFLHKGSYSYKPDLFGFSQGVYLNTCIIGQTKRTMKILIIK
jgi:hypothetical protein